MINKGANIHFKKKSTAHINSKQGKIIVTSQNGMDINRTASTITAKQNVHVTNEGKTLTADHIVLYYTNEQDMRIDRIEATGHVVTRDKDNKITADKMVMYYNTDKENHVRTIIATGNVVASNPKNKITGNSGEYVPSKQTITMFGDVVLHQGGSFVKGSEAWLNMATGDSNLKNEEKTATGKKKGRVTGTFMPQEWTKH
jgi:lipopolysaccharide transport protein LptA